MLAKKRKLDTAAKQKRVVPGPEERLERGSASKKLQFIYLINWLGLTPH